MKAVALLAVLFLAGCSGKKNEEAAPADEPGTVACESNQDCPSGWICLAGECASASQKQIYTDPKNAVTPEKVQKHMIQLEEKAADRVDKAMDVE